MSSADATPADVIGVEEARQITGPYMALFRRCIEDAIRLVEDRERTDAEFFRVYPSGTRAALVFWQIVHLAETRFTGLEGASTSRNRGFLTILIADKLEIRFKKLNRKGLPRLPRTRTARTYSLQMRLLGMEEPTRATAGYQLNADGSLKDIILACQHGNELLWTTPLPADGAGFVAHPATKKDDGDDKPKVRLKQG